MANRLRWWVIPGALVVLLGTLLRIGGSRVPTVVAAPETASGAPAVASERAAVVAVQDASGPRVRRDEVAGAHDAFVLGFGRIAAGQWVELTIWRRDAAAVGGRTLWSELRPKLRADGTVPMLGVPAGDYDVEARFADGAQVQLTRITAPGMHAAALPAMPSR